MDWVADVGKARDGDADARERLGEHVTPFVHAVLLAQVPHHVAHRLVPRVLEELHASLKGIADEAAGTHALAIARRLAETGAKAGVEEAPSSNAQVNEGRQLLRRMRGLKVPERERLLLRLVAGVPGPEQAEFEAVKPDAVRADLERGAVSLAQSLGQSASFAGDPYLWEAVGAPSSLLARLEMQLTALRFAPGASELSVVGDGDNAATFTSLSKVEQKEKKSPWGEDDITESQPRGKLEREQVMTEPSVPAAPNPFKAGAPTIAAADLPAAAAAGPIPAAPPSRNPIAPIPSGSQSRPPQGAAPATTPSQAPIAPIPSGSQSGKSLGQRASKAALQPMTAPMAPVEARPAVANAATRLNPVHGPGADEASVATATPLGAPGGIANAYTQIRLGPVAPPRAVWISTRGAAPFIMAGALGVIALVGGWVAVTSSERAAKGAWQMTEVVVAAEDMNEGAIITQENIAIRSVPDSFVTTMVVRPSQLGLVLEQRLAVPVQTGDPLIYNQLAAVRVSERLSARIVQRARAVSIAVDTLTAVGRWVRPGDHVDVLSAFEDPKRGRTAVTFLQNVPVVAAGPMTGFMPEKSINERKRIYQNVTFLLTPEEVEALTLATQVGKVTLTLRTEEDFELKDREYNTQMKTLLTGERQRLLEQQRFRTIQMIRTAPKEPKEKDPKREHK